MSNIDFEVSSLREVTTEERGQANKILAYVNGDINVDGKKITRLNGLKLQDSRYYGKKIVDVPQTRGNDGTYRNLYELGHDVKKAIEKAVLNAYEARKASDTQS